MRSSSTLPSRRKTPRPARRARTRRARRKATAAESKHLALIYTYALWTLVVFDIHRWLGAIGPSVFQRALTFLFVPLLVMGVVYGPTIAAWIRPWMAMPPFLAYVGVSALSVLTAYNTGRALATLEGLVLYYILILATVVFVRRPHHAIPILALFPLQYIWWALHAKASGVVRWHSAYANTDGFGPLVVMGMGVCYFAALATGSKRLRWLFLALAGYCVLGVVSSFARGAVLSAGGVAFLIWLRSPRKLVGAAAVASAVAIVLVSSSVLFPRGAFWAEMRSAFVEGTEEGTGQDRWQLWQAAYRVFQERPLLGVGGNNFGAFAAEFFGYGDVPGYENPGKLYGRNLHSIYAQIMSEFGLAGCLAFLWILFGFWKRNRALRRPQFVRTWAEATGGDLDLRYLSLMLEAAMVGFLLTGAFYAQLYHHWFYTLLGTNLMLYGAIRRMISKSGGRPAPRSAHRRAVRRRRAW